MMRRALALILSTTCLISCSDMLGLDGLSYDQGPMTVQATGGSGSDQVIDPDFVGDGDVRIEPVYRDTDFPALWPEDSLVVTMPASANSSLYWVYSPSEQVLYSYELDLEGHDLLGRQAWPENVPVSHLVAVPGADGPFLIAYSDEYGWTTWVRNVLGTGELNWVTRGGSSDRTHVLVARDQDDYLLVVYDAVDGGYRYVPTSEHAARKSGLGNWGPGWTHIQPYSVGGEDGLLLFNTLSGALSFRIFPALNSEGVELDSSAAGLPERYSTTLEVEADQMLTVWQGPSANIAFYDADKGLLKVLSLADDGLGELGWGGASSGWQSFETEARLPEGLQLLAPLSQSLNIFLGFDGNTASLYRWDSHPVVVR